jgi:hypothetical protein
VYPASIGILHQPKMNRARDTLFRVMLWCGMLVFAVALIPRLYRALPLNDFIEYWSAARLFITGGNPYSGAEMLRVEQSLGWSSPEALPMLNPPWVLTIFAPLAALPFRTAQILWFIVSAALLFASADLLWRYYGGRPDQRVVAWACAALFFPNPVALRMGQVAPIILFGLVAFLVSMRSRSPWLAGVALFVLGMKPHLLVPLGLVLMIWIIQRRNWTVLGGLTLVVAVATAVAIVVNPAALTGYIHLWANTPPVDLLRYRFGFEQTWLQLLPLVVGVGWVLIRWRRWGLRWDWGEQMPALLLGSLISAPYVWTFDQPVLTIALIRGAVAISKRRWWLIAAAFAAGDAIMAVLIFGEAPGYLFLWSVPFWALLYAAAMRREAKIEP